MKNYIKELRSKFKKYEIDGYVVPKNDDYFTEYSKLNRLEIISNFSGSAGLAIILKNKNYLLVHQWGDDLGWIKKVLALPLKSVESMFITVGIAAFLIAAFTPTWLILNGAEVDMGYFGYHRIAWFLYAFIMLCSLSTFICFSQNVYPSEYQWNKKTYN